MREETLIPEDDGPGNEAAGGFVGAAEQSRRAQFEVLTSSSSGRVAPVRVALASIGFVALAAGVAWILPHRHVDAPATIFLMAVLAATLTATIWAGVIASLLGLATLDVLFIGPRYRFGFRSSDDVALAVVFLLAAVLASWVLSRLQRARSLAEQERNRALAMATIARGLATATTVEDVGATVVDVGARALGAKAAGVFLLDPGQEELVRLAAAGYPAEIERRWVRFPLSAHVPATEAVRDRRPVLLGSMSERSAHAGVTHLTMGPGSLAALPILADDEILGAITLNFSEDHRFDQDDTEFLAIFALQCAQAIERVRLEEDERQLRERSEFLAEASALLGGSLDYERTLEDVARLAVPRFADWVAVDMLTEDGRIELVAVTHRDPEMVRWAWQLRERFPASLSDQTGIGPVIRDGQPQFYPDLSQEELEESATDDQQLEIIRKLALRAAILVPLIAREKVLGALTLIYSESGRRYTPIELELAKDLAARAATAIDNARLHRSEQEARAAMETTEARLRILSEASRVLGASLELNDTLNRVASLAVEHVADSAVVYLANPDGALRSVAIAHVDPERLPDLERLERLYEPLGEQSPVLRAFRTSEPEAIENVDERALSVILGPELAALVGRIGVSSGLAVPLLVGSRSLGVLALAWSTQRRVAEADQAFGLELADRMARAIENARLYQSERSARAEVEWYSERQRLASQASELLTESLDYPAAFEQLARIVVGELADLCLIDVVEDGNLVRVTAAHADPAEQHLADRLQANYAPRLDSDHPAARVIRTGAAELGREMSEEFLRNTTRDDEHLAIVLALGFQSFMCVPLIARGRILGAITFVSCDPARRYGPGDLSLALDIARSAAVRIDNARLFNERDLIARSLQQILLPEELPRIPGFELAATYQPGREGMEVGGDFYDAFQRPDGTFGIAIGDVCGHGPEAAAVMGVARQTIRVAGMNETRPSAILAVLNEALMLGGYERFVTVCDVRARPGPESTRLTVSAAGHPLPLLVRADGTVEAVGAHGMVLGVLDEIALTDATAEMYPGDALVLYTDGLIEWPSRAYVDIRPFLSSVAGRSAREIVEAIEAWWHRGTDGAGRDDAAVLVLVSLPPDQEGSLTTP